MNKYILFLMRDQDDPESFIQEGKKISGDVRVDLFSEVGYAAYSAYIYQDNVPYCEYWMNEYFKLSGEDKQNYIDEVERLKL